MSQVSHDGIDGGQSGYVLGGCHGREKEYGGKREETWYIFEGRCTALAKRNILLFNQVKNMVCQPSTGT